VAWSGLLLLGHRVRLHSARPMRGLSERLS